MKKLLFTALTTILLYTGCNTEKDYWDYMKRHDYKGALEYLVKNKKWTDALRHTKIYRIKGYDEIAEMCWKDLSKSNEFKDAVDAYKCAHVLNEQLSKEAEMKVYQLAEHVEDPADIFKAWRGLDIEGFKDVAKSLREIMVAKFGELEFWNVPEGNHFGIVAVKNIADRKYYYDRNRHDWIEFIPPK